VFYDVKGKIFLKRFLAGNSVVKYVGCLCRIHKKLLSTMSGDVIVKTEHNAAAAAAATAAVVVGAAAAAAAATAYCCL